MRNPISRIFNAVKSIRHRLAEPLRLELSLVDHCNLNCKGCTHYCPIAPEHYMDIEAMEHNLAHLANIDNHMFHDIYLLGGEPLLHPRVADACRLSRKYFPTATIKLLTNGVSINKMGDDFWDACRQTDTTISATIYPVKIDYDLVERLCQQNGVKYEIFHQEKDGLFFSKHTIDDRHPGNRHLNYLKCHQVGCLTLRDNRIYPCSTAAYADLVNDAFDRHFEWVEPTDGCHGGDYLEVNSITSKRQIERLKTRPTPFCRYCTKIEPTNWSTSRRHPSEWL